MDIITLCSVLGVMIAFAALVAEVVKTASKK